MRREENPDGKNHQRTKDRNAGRALEAKAVAKPYWRAIDTGLHQGYRRGINGGAWVGRRYVGKETYETKTLAIADDHGAAEGVNILNFFQAQSRIREWAAQARAQAPAKGPLTVDMALDSYFDRLEQEGSKSLADARGRVALHIRPALGEVLVADLTRDMIAGWLAGVAEKAAGRKAGPETTRGEATGPARTVS
jgi:hypothetical protein